MKTIFQYKALGAFIVIAATLLIGFQNCAKVGFQGSASSPSSAIAGALCPDVSAIARQTKIIFVVDTSGSNREATTNNGTELCGSATNCTPATDPQKAFRYGSIENFFATYRSKTNFQWGFVIFSGTSAKSLIGGNQLSSQPSDMEAAINDFYHNVIDADSTPYLEALRAAQSIIQNDPDLNSPSHPQYVVIMVSDGYPTDYSLGSDFATGSIANEITQIQATAPGRIVLSTIYYGQINDPNAIQLLQNMAAKGSGQFASVNGSGSTFKIDDVIPGGACQ